MVAKGYKQTEIGVIPEDWDIAKLEDIVEASAGLVRGPFGGSLKKEHFVKNGYKVYEQKNAIYSTKEIGEYYISDEKYNELKRFEVKEGDFIVSCSGTIGKIYQIPKNAPKGIINQALLKISIDSTKTNKIFFLVIFKWNKFQSKIIDSTQGGAMKNLVGMEIFRKTLLPLPPKQEQKAIATALSDVDSLITSLEELITKKEAIKTATMQQLLTGKKRLAGFSGEWVEKKLGEIFEITAGKDLVKAQYSNQKDDVYKYPIYANSIFNEGIYGYSTFMENQADCITVTARGTLGIAFHRTEPFVAIGRLIILTPKIKLDSYYITQAINQNLDFANESTSVPQLTAPQISQYNLMFPPVEEQQAIAQILSDMDKEIEALKTKLEKTKAIKQGMMQELLTGRVRLVS